MSLAKFDLRKQALLPIYSMQRRTIGIVITMFNSGCKNTLGRLTSSTCQGCGRPVSKINTPPPSPKNHPREVRIRNNYHRINNLTISPHVLIRKQAPQNRTFLTKNGTK